MGRMHNYIKLVQWSINNSKYIFELTFLLQFENRLYLGCSSWKGNKETKEGNHLVKMSTNRWEDEPRIKLYLTHFYLVLNQVYMDLDMFGLVTLTWIGRKVHNTDIITINNGGMTCRLLKFHKSHFESKMFLWLHLQLCVFDFNTRSGNGSYLLDNQDKRLCSRKTQFSEVERLVVGQLTHQYLNMQ